MLAQCLLFFVICRTKVFAESGSRNADESVLLTNFLLGKSFVGEFAEAEL